MHTGVNVSDCTGEGGGRVCAQTLEKTALKVDWGKNPLPHQEIGMSDVPVRLSTY